MLHHRDHDAVMRQFGAPARYVTLYGLFLYGAVVVLMQLLVQSQPSPLRVRQTGVGFGGVGRLQTSV